jgi:hypothetical protein
VHAAEGCFGVSLNTTVPLVPYVPDVSKATANCDVSAVPPVTNATASGSALDCG